MFSNGIIKFAVTAWLLSQNVQAEIRTTTKVCPMLGPSFPMPSALASSVYIQDALYELDQKLDLTLESGEINLGNAHLNATTFSIGLFSVNDQGLIYQRHYTDPYVANSSVGVNVVDADTIYRIGSISKLITTYIFLILEGDSRFYHPITNYIPELAAATKSSSEGGPYGVLPQWNEITIADLATHTAGIYDDYGLDDIEKGGPHYQGLPELPKNRIPKCAFQIGYRFYPCTRKEFLEGIAQLPALFAVADTPSYSNAGFDLFGIVIENISGVPLEQSFNESFVKALNLTGTYYKMPNDPSHGAIPVSEFVSGWNQNLSTSNPDGGNFMSTNDMAIVGKAIMNSTLLPRSVTRRWMQPRLFTGNPRTPLGAPWEIYRWETPSRIYDFYTKEGEEGNYASLFVLIPDLGLGYSVNTVGRLSHATGAELLAGIIAEAIVPAVENAAKQQADLNFGGRYSNSQINSSLVVTTDDQLGLRVTEWISNGTDLLSQLGGTRDGHYVDFRLWPNELYSGRQVGFTASWQTMPRAVDKGPLPPQCYTWLDTGGTQYGNVALGSFVFEVNQSSGAAIRLSLKAFPIILERENMY